MKIAVLLTLGVALLLAACSGDDRSPTQPPTILYSFEDPDVWRGSSTITAVSAPAPCAAQEQQRIGEVSKRSFYVDRSGSSIVFTTEFGPDVGYVGTVDGNEFRAEDPGGPTSHPSACGAVTSVYGGIEGRFSEDQRTIWAREFWALRLEAGGEIRWIFELTLER